MDEPGCQYIRQDAALMQRLSLPVIPPCISISPKVNSVQFMAGVSPQISKPCTARLKPTWQFAKMK